VGADCWARAAPLTAMQPASMATISFVLRMTSLLERVRLGKHCDVRREGIAHR
jgi:hypothetical protein